MSKTTDTIWPREPHTEAKHAILRKYLDAWLPIITRWNGRVVYIDGFAGPGEYIGGDNGSPIIAIKAVLEHTANILADIRMLFMGLLCRIPRGLPRGGMHALPRGL